MTHAQPGSTEQPTFAAIPQPNLDDLAIDAVLHLGAALEVLELHARHKVTAINCVCRDLLRIYYAKADQAQSLEPQDKELLGLLHDTAVDLGYAIEVVDHLNGDEADDPILYAVSYLLKAAKRFADEGVAVALAVKGYGAGLPPALQGPGFRGRV